MADLPPSTIPAHARSVAVDLVRVAGITAVVLAHSAGGPPEGPDNLIRVLTFSWPVPLFFFLTGYLRKPGRSVRDEARRRATSLLVPYGWWLLIIGTPYLAYQTIRDGGPPLDQIFGAVWGGALMRGVLGPFWFLPALFFVAVLRTALDRTPGWIPWTIAATGTLAGYAWGPELSAWIPLDATAAWAGLLYVLVGEQARRIRLRGLASVLAGLGLLIGSAVLLLTRLVPPMDIKLGDFGTPLWSTLVSIAISVGLVWTARGMLDARRPDWAPFVTELATVSIVVLLTHSSFLYITGAFLPPWLMFLVALGGSWTLAWIVHRTRLSLPLAGVPRVTWWWPGTGASPERSASIGGQSHPWSRGETRAGTTARRRSRAPAETDAANRSTKT